MVSFFGKVADLLYIKPLRFISRATFRYAVTGGMNMVFNVVLYWFCFNILLAKADTDFGVVVISAPVLAFLITFVVTFFSGFWLTRNVAFPGGKFGSRTQLVRYGAVVAVNIAINYFGIKLLVNVWELYPSPSYAAIQVVTVAFSYLMQRYFTFRK